MGEREFREQIQEWAKPRYENIEGAPFKLGAKVKVTSINDESDLQHHLGKFGVVVYFEYDCGCGQTFPDDPMIGVKFKNGSIDEFWKDELTEVALKRAPEGA